MYVLLTLLIAVLSLPAFADEKKTGPRLTELGITTFVIEQGTGTKQLELELRAGERAVASVTIDILSEEDHIVKYEPVEGEPFVVESLMSKLEVIFRTEHESTTARFDPKTVEWKRTGSVGLFERLTPNADIVGAVIAELGERGMLRNPELPAR